MLPMAFDDASMDADLCEELVAHEVVLGEEWTDGRNRLGVVCVTEGDEGLEQRLLTRGPRQRVARTTWSRSG